MSTKPSMNDHARFTEFMCPVQVIVFPIWDRIEDTENALNVCQSMEQLRAIISALNKLFLRLRRRIPKG